MTGDAKAPSKMSPASQGSLEVEKYIGSCLISHSTRGKNKNKKHGPPSGNNRPEGSNNNNSGSGNTSSASNYKGDKKSVVSVHCSVHNAGPYGSLLPLCDRTCGGYKFNARSNYGDRSCGWAGMPLISMADSRRNKKTGGNGCVQRPNKSSVHPHPSSSSPPPPHAQIVKNNKKDAPCPGDVFHKGPSLNRRTPLTHLAIHTQGAPLILSSNRGNRKNSQRGEGLSPARLLRGGDLVLPHAKNGRKDSVSDSSIQREYGGKQGTNNGRSVEKDHVGDTGKEGGTSAGVGPSDCMSVASDESSGHSENSLPRIIKPRKRRKKDRKPNKPPGDNSNPANAGESSTIVTLQPYVPLCYDLDKHCNTNDTEKAQEETEKKITVNAEKVPPVVTSEASDDPLLTEDITGHASVGTPTAYPYPPSSLCQCRYCDPEGLIWDVDQHCYSPFLTPPLSPSDMSYSKSPFASIPLFLSPPPDVLKGFDFKDSFFDNVFEGDSLFSLHSELRRSKSEPSGRVVDIENACDKYQNRSQGLEVSTEIVTSPNGHRDIEIKFYSSALKCDDTPSGGDKMLREDSGVNISEICSENVSAGDNCKSEGVDRATSLSIKSENELC